MSVQATGFDETLRQRTAAAAEAAIAGLPDRPEYHQDPYAFPCDLARRLIEATGRFAPLCVAICPEEDGYRFRVSMLEQSPEESLKKLRRWVRKRRAIAVILLQQIASGGTDGKRIVVHVEYAEANTHGVFGIFGFDTEKETFIDATHKEMLPRGKGITRVI